MRGGITKSLQFLVYGGCCHYNVLSGPANSSDDPACDIPSINKSSNVISQWLTGSDIATINLAQMIA